MFPKCNLMSGTFLKQTVSISLTVRSNTLCCTELVRWDLYTTASKSYNADDLWHTVHLAVISGARDNCSTTMHPSKEVPMKMASVERFPGNLTDVFGETNCREMIFLSDENSPSVPFDDRCCE
jgi:hypothetical protein